MSKITINVDDATIALLDGRAREHGRTPEEEARQVLSAALASEPDNMAKRLADRFSPVGGVELLIPSRPMFEDPVFTFWDEEDFPSQ